MKALKVLVFDLEIWHPCRKAWLLAMNLGIMKIMHLAFALRSCSILAIAFALLVFCILSHLSWHRAFSLLYMFPTKGMSWYCVRSFVSVNMVYILEIYIFFIFKRISIRTIIKIVKPSWIRHWFVSRNMIYILLILFMFKSIFLPEIL